LRWALTAKEAAQIRIAKKGFIVFMTLIIVQSKQKYYSGQNICCKKIKD
jgi:hypothetical protein